MFDKRFWAVALYIHITKFGNSAYIINPKAAEPNIIMRLKISLNTKKASLTL